MASKRSTLYCAQGLRSKRILALVPSHNADSEVSGSSDSDDGSLDKITIAGRADPPSSSSAPSIASSLERLNISSPFEQQLDEEGDLFDNVAKAADSSGSLPQVPQDPRSDTESLNSVPPPSVSCLLSVSPIQNPPSVTTSFILDQVETISPLVSIPQRSRHSRPTPSGHASNVTPNTRSKRTKRQKAAPKRVAKKKKMNINFKWTNRQFQYRAELGDDHFESPLPEGNKTALCYFFDFFSQDMFEQICQNTNLYSVQKKGRSIHLSVDELRNFLAIKIMMGVVSMPSYLDYWHTETRYAPIADIMTLKRYQLIRRYIHFVDNDEANNDPYFKISSLVDKVRQNCLAVEEEKRFSIDEMTIPYKGTKAGKKRQYNPRKPRKWGFKNIVRAGASGFIYDFFLYAGQDEFEDCGFNDEEAVLGWGAKAVLRLCKTIKKKPCVVYFDNFFSSLELIYHLRETYGIFSLGTMRSNRLRDSQTHLKSDKQLKAQGRGAFCQTTCNEKKVAIVKWNDNKCVVLASSYSDAYPLSTVKRYCKIKKQKINVQYPNIVKHYNAHMGGVDLADMLVALYRTEMKTRRWYLSIFSQIIDICVNNAWLLYRRDSTRKGIKKQMALKRFRLQIFQGLLKADKRASVTVPAAMEVIRKPNRILPVDDIKYDGLDHFANFLDTYGRCCYCKSGRTDVHCIKCKVRLCLVRKRNCFYNFHNKN